MEEKKEKFEIEAEDIKNETIETAKKVKETIKNTKIKDETKNVKNFIIDMLKNPLDKIKEIANEKSCKFLKIAIIMLIVWIIIVFISSAYSTVYYWGFSKLFKNILSVLKKVLAPIIGVLVYSVIIFVLNKKNNKKPLTTIISTVTVTQIPLIIASLVSLLTIISSDISTITNPFNKLCSTITIVLNYFGFKFLFEEENDKSFIIKFALIQAIYYVVYIIMGLLGIYI